MSFISKLIKNIFKFFLPDSIYIRYEYFKLHRRFYSDKKIETFSDRIFSWKLDNKLASFSTFVDKYKVRDFVSDKVGDNYLPKLIKTISAPEDFELTDMPNKFVMKLNNGCGYNFVVKDKNALNTASIRKMIRKWLDSDFYALSKEKQYKNVKQLIIIEEFIESSGILKDYKFYCIDGKIEFIQVISERSNGSQRHNYYSKEWKPLEISRKEYPKGDLEAKPVLLEQAVKVVEVLSSSFSFVRVDLYIQEKIFFGELTFTPGNGYIKYYPDSFDKLLASKMKLEFKPTK